jgi:transposase
MEISEPRGPRHCGAIRRNMLQTPGDKHLITRRRKISPTPVAIIAEGGAVRFGTAQRGFVSEMPRGTADDSKRSLMVPGEDAATSAAFSKPSDKKAGRKVFTLSYKLRILECAEELQGRGGLTEFLRREGLYPSHLSQWRKQRAEEKLGQGKRGRPGKEALPLHKENAVLKRRIAVLGRNLAEAEFLLRLQGEMMAPLSPEAWPLDWNKVMERVDEARKESTILRICEVLKIPRREYYKWLKRRSAHAPHPKAGMRPAEKGFRSDVRLKARKTP